MMPPAIAIGHLAAHHVADDPVFADRLRSAVHGLHRRTVAQHGDGVGHLGNFVELVRDEDRGNPVSLQLEQHVRLALRMP